MELRPGALVNGRYLVVKCLGHGGMGTVYLADELGRSGVARQVAVKVLEEQEGDHDDVARFLAEARLAAQLDHPNIARIYELGEDDAHAQPRLHVLAMEYVPGHDLRELLTKVDAREGRVPLPLCVFIVARLCEALDFAHAVCDRDGQPLKLVHRDVTPTNCMISYAGEVKLIDFGIALASNITSRTRTGAVRGKLGYLSPEQSLGQPLDHRSDLFSLGVMLYELLIGARPFELEDDSELRILERVRRGEHPTVRSLDPELPEALDRIVERALTVDRSQRYQRGGELLADLQRFLVEQHLMVTASELGAFVVELAGPAAASPELERTPRGPSELRTRVITRPEHTPEAGLRPLGAEAPVKTERLEPIREDASVPTAPAVAAVRRPRVDRPTRKRPTMPPDDAAPTVVHSHDRTVSTDSGGAAAALAPTEEVSTDLVKRAMARPAAPKKPR